MSASTITKRKQNKAIIEVSNESVVEEIKHVHEDPDTDYGYHKMTSQLGILGYKMHRDETKHTIKLKIKHNQISDNMSLKCSSSQDIVITPISADEKYLI